MNDITAPTENHVVIVCVDLPPPTAPPSRAWERTARKKHTSAGAASVRKGDDSMATPKEVEKLIEERDSALRSLADKETELTAFQKAAQEREAALKAACPPAEAPFSINWQMVGKY